VISYLEHGFLLADDVSGGYFQDWSGKDKRIWNIESL